MTPNASNKEYGQAAPDKDSEESTTYDDAHQAAKPKTTHLSDRMTREEAQAMRDRALDHFTADTMDGSSDFSLAQDEFVSGAPDLAGIPLEHSSSNNSETAPTASQEVLPSQIPALNLDHLRQTPTLNAMALRLDTPRGLDRTAKPIKLPQDKSITKLH